MHRDGSKAPLKILFFGLGSIGRRHARLISNNFDHHLFAFRNSKKSKPNKLGIKELCYWREVKKLSPDVAFITNPTYMHLKTAINCARLGINLFIEKPIDCDTGRLNELIRLVRKKRLTNYIAYCMRFHPAIMQMKDYLANKRPMHCRVTVSSYLPDWRERRDYNRIYSTQKAKGGGVILDLSHEIDYIQYLFGDILEMQGAYGRISKLKINCEDYADIIFKCKKGVVNLHMNFFSKNLERTVHIDFGDSSYMKADLINNVLLINKNGRERTYRYNSEWDDIYLAQLDYFFKHLNKEKIMNNLIDAGKLFRKITAFKNKYEK